MTKADDFLEDFKNTVDEMGKAAMAKSGKAAEKDLKKNNGKFIV